MKKYTLLVGNDINNVVSDNSWKNLIKEIITFCGATESVTNLTNKPFPLLYEEIFLKSIKIKHRNEKDLKKFISGKVSNIKSNEIHELIRNLNIANIITTNYEFTLEGVTPKKSSSIIEERLYSIFRHYEIGSKKYWHIHGDCRIPSSINLGFEHYSGQLQQIRNYTVTGTNYKNTKISRIPLIKRLPINKLDAHSWIDLFFNSDLYIFGLSLDFVETDLWWLLTYRARLLFYKKNSEINNEIYYFIPSEMKAKEKIDLLETNGVIIVNKFSGENKLKYYTDILNYIQSDINQVDINL